MSIKSSCISLTLLTALAPGQTRAADGASDCRAPDNVPRELTFMSRKLYAGADLAILNTLGSATPEELAARVPSIREALNRADFPSRAALMAAEVEAIQPDFIGIQEAIVIRGQEPGDGTATAATEVELDLLQTYLLALEVRGLKYEVVAQRATLDVEFEGADLRDLRYTDGVAILVRSALKLDVEVSNPRAELLSAECVIPSAVGLIPLARGWASVDVVVPGGPRFSLFVSHLDFTCLGPGVSVQQAQGFELEEVTRSEDPVILIAALNSAADPGDASINPEDLAWQAHRQLLMTPTYGDLIGSGFSDAWPQDGGYNCCFVDDLVSLARTTDLNIDSILQRGANFATRAAGNTGLTETTVGGTRPSNHAGTWVTLTLDSAPPSGPIRAPR